tara:strand:- start:90 stop:515 length:426 start_codon:yes stop_codon:yes gene_type:complete
MFAELEKYKINDHFFFSKNDDLNEVCNAPKDGIGVYTVFELKKGNIDLVYIGSSGKLKQNGSVKVRKGGMFDRIVNGKQFGGTRKDTWKQKLISEKIEALDIYWYRTFDKNSSDLPSMIKGVIIQRYFEIYGSLPRWNKEF